ncbi:MAG: hypothetical protein AAFR73_02375 [Pseudomonadota bacterium]
MTVPSKLWAFSVLALSLYAGVAIMAGQIPGANSGIGVFEWIASLIEPQVEAHGVIFTGIGVMLIGLCLAAACLIGGERSPDVDWWDVDFGDGGD